MHSTYQPTASRLPVSLSLFVKLCLICMLTLCNTAKAQDLQLNGIASYQELNKEMFMAGLYLPTTTSDISLVRGMAEPQRMELRVTAKRVSSRRLINLFLQNMAINNRPDLLSENADHMVTFTSLLKGKLLRGDILSFERAPESQETKIVLNTVTLGSVTSSDFFDLLLNTWIGGVPPSTDFKASLLAGGAMADEAIARFESTQPTDDRIAATQNRGKPKPKLALPAAPLPSTDTPSIAAPTLEKPDAPSIAGTEVDVEKPQAPTAPAPKEEKPVTAAIEPKQEEPESEDDAVFDDDDEAEVEILTAESILARQRYMADLVKLTYQKLRYPKRAQSKGYEGSVRLRVTIDRTGKIVQLDTLEASKYKVFNSAAVKAVGKASPYPKMPENVPGKTFDFVLPIAFRLQ